MNIYTKTGDKGTTSLGNGQRISKSDIRVEAYGTIDELNSHIGLLRSMDIEEQHKSTLLNIQNMLMRCGSFVAQCKGFEASNDDVRMLEQEIDSLQKKLPPLKHFILPGGNLAAAQCHVARCICRRAERITIQLNEIQDVKEDILVIILNRLSDYFFVLSRIILQASKIEEKYWITND